MGPECRMTTALEASSEPSLVTRTVAPRNADGGNLSSGRQMMKPRPEAPQLLKGRAKMLFEPWWGYRASSSVVLEGGMERGWGEPRAWNHNPQGQVPALSLPKASNQAQVWPS